ncbi:ead/Ea22-like family protein [Citrobacter freundii]|uniref:ead/Ea22-like family protein n=1 Tax=Citrobacter freundii TaxID=546 RepID=UPI0023AFBE61|nr:ead/Ea22-like family protein [Citrobacter freundii]
MTALNKQALREAANAANTASWGKWESYKPHKSARGYEVKVGAKAVAQHCLKVDAAFIAAANPQTVLALLDENYRLTAERDALRENIGGDNTRAAADIYFQLVEECEIPPGGSLVGYVDDIKERLSNAEKRIAELESRTVNLPKRSVGGVMHMSGFSRDYAEGWCAGNDNAIHKIRAAGIGVKGN